MGSRTTLTTQPWVRAQAPERKMVGACEQVGAAWQFVDLVPNAGSCGHATAAGSPHVGLSGKREPGGGGSGAGAARPSGPRRASFPEGAPCRRRQRRRSRVGRGRDPGASQDRWVPWQACWKRPQGPVGREGGSEKHGLETPYAGTHQLLLRPRQGSEEKVMAQSGSRALRNPRKITCCCFFHLREALKVLLFGFCEHIRDKKQKQKTRDNERET